VLVAALYACEGSSGVAERSIAGNVDLLTARTLVVDSVVEVIVTGNPRADDIAYALDAVVTASTATVANRLADRLVIGVDRPEDDVVRVRLDPLDNGTLSGQLRLTVPSDLDLGVLQRAAQVTVDSMDAVVQVDSIGAVRIVDPGGYVSVGVQTGAVVVESTLPVGETTEVSVRNGDIQLLVPQQISAAISATAGGAGSVQIQHPSLPRPLANRPYAATVNGGLNSVRLSTMNGSVFIQVQQ
jgi:hypothetical protein